VRSKRLKECENGNIKAKEFGSGVVFLVAELCRGYRCGMGKVKGVWNGEGGKGKR
jgi:hypothetical protein